MLNHKYALTFDLVPSISIALRRSLKHVFDHYHKTTGTFWSISSDALILMEDMMAPIITYFPSVALVSEKIVEAT